MCYALAPAIIAAVASVTSATVSAYASYQSGQTQKKAAEYNAEIQRRAATDAAQRGSIEAAEHRTQVRKLIAEQRVGQAASGVDINTGTPLDVQVETKGMGELDALRIMNNAQRTAWGHNAQAELDLFQGKAAGRAGTLNAGASLLSGASNAYFGYKSAMGR